MNDCVWQMIGLCDRDKCRCRKYLSANSKEGREIHDEVNELIIDMLEPLEKFFRKTYNFREEDK